MQILRKHRVCWHGSEDFCSNQDCTKLVHSDFTQTPVFPLRNLLTNAEAVYFMFCRAEAICEGVT